MSSNATLVRNVVLTRIIISIVLQELQELYLGANILILTQYTDKCMNVYDGAIDVTRWVHGASRPQNKCNRIRNTPSCRLHQSPGLEDRKNNTSARSLHPQPGS